MDIVMKAKTWLKPPRRRRKHIDQAELRRLADSIVSLGMMNPIECTPTGEIISGDRRGLAALGDDRITEIPVRIVSDPLTATQIRIRRVSENLQRSDLSLQDKYEECKGFMEDQPGISQKEIAALLHVDASTITRIMALERCVLEVRENADVIGVRALYDIAKESPERQKELLQKALEGGAAEVAKARKQRSVNGTVPAAKAAKLRIPLPSGVVITVAGEELSLEDAIRELSDALAEMRKAEKQNLDIKTFAAVCRDRAKAAG
jgi:ParB family transcriptional regulator, chromosome partitioning protein